MGKSLVRLLLLLTMIVAGSAVTSWLVVSAYVQQVQQALQLQDWDLAPSLSDIWRAGRTQQTAQLADAALESPITEEAVSEETVAIDDEDEAVTGRVYETEAETEVDDVASAGSMLEPPPSDVAEAGATEEGSFWWEQAETEETMAQQSLVISMADFQHFRDQLTEGESVQLLATIMQRLPQEVIQSLSYYLEDGVTIEEWGAIEQLAAEYLEPAEWERLLGWLDGVANLP